MTAKESEKRKSSWVGFAVLGLFTHELRRKLLGAWVAPDVLFDR